MQLQFNLIADQNIENKLDDLDEKKVDRRQLGQLLVSLGEKIGKE